MGFFWQERNYTPSRSFNLSRKQWSIYSNVCDKNSSGNYTHRLSKLHFGRLYLQHSSQERDLAAKHEDCRNNQRAFMTFSKIVWTSRFLNCLMFWKISSLCILFSILYVYTDTSIYELYKFISIWQRSKTASIALWNCMKGHDLTYPL